MPHDARQRALHLLEGTHAAAGRAAGQKAGEQLVQLDLMGRDLMLDEGADDREQQNDEREGGEEQVEGERAGEKRNVVFEGRLQRAPHDAGDGPMPPAFGPHAAPPPGAVRPAVTAAHPAASRSSGAATATARGTACDWSGGFTWRSTTARVSATRSCSNRNANVRSRSAAIAPRAPSGRSHSRRLNGPIAFLRLL